MPRSQTRRYSRSNPACSAYRWSNRRRPSRRLRVRWLPMEHFRERSAGPRTRRGICAVGAGVSAARAQPGDAGRRTRHARLDAGQPAGQHVLDAGCGSGRYMLHALRRGARHVTGVDLSPQMLQRAGAELAQEWQAARIGLQQGRLDQLPMPDAVADLSVCGLVVGHLQRLWPALEELHRVTRVGGIVLCSDVHPIATRWAGDAISKRTGSTTLCGIRNISTATGIRRAPHSASQSKPLPSRCWTLRIFRPVRVSTRRRCRCRLRWCCGCDASREQDVARGIGCL